jgi:hypothetical protein
MWPESARSASEFVYRAPINSAIRNVDVMMRAVFRG